jgi:hypothetical protein
MANPLSYLYSVPAYRCDGCGSVHAHEGSALSCCNSSMTECGVTELGSQSDSEVDIGMVPCWYLEEAGQLRLF